MKNLVRRSVIFFILCLNVFCVFPYSGLMAGQKNLKTFSTKWFDFIFSQDSARTAAIISESADEIFEELLHNFGITPDSKWKIPVTISPSTELFNAYMTNVLFNHLVIYDCVPDEETAFSADAILDTFRHELTHSVSIFFTAGYVEKYPLDLTVAGVLSAPAFIKEGATIFEESQGGSGRLNNEFYLHMAKQAKLENKFPNWSDVFGARDIYPNGSECYGFGGIFADYLIQTYGREKYNLLWSTMNNSGRITFHGSFKKVYKKPIKEVWQEFYDWVEVPLVAELNEVELDVFPNKKYDLYKYNCGSSTHFATYNASSSYVLLDGKKFLRMANVCGLALSEDGKFLAVSYYDFNSQNIKTKVKVFDTETGGGFKEISESCLRDGTIVTVNKKNYLAAVKSYSQNQKIVLFDFMNGSLVKEFDLPQHVYSLTNGGYGQLAFLTKNNDNWKICVTSGNILEGDFLFVEYNPGTKLQNFKMRSLMLTGLRKEGDKIERSFAFSYGAQKKIPRLGFFDVEGFGNNFQSRFRLMEDEISGGVYDPACWNNKILYSSHNYENFHLHQIDVSKFKFNELDGIWERKNFELQNQNVDAEFIANSKPYRKLYYNNGILLPVSIVPQYGFSSLDYSLTLYNIDSSELILFPGVTWITSTPWDSDFLIASMGYDLFTNSFGIQTSFFNKTDTGFFNYMVTPEIIFDQEGFKQVSNDAEISSQIFLNNNVSFSASDSNVIFYGRPQYLTSDELNVRVQNPKFGESFTDYIGYMRTMWNSNLAVVANVASLSVSNVHKNNSRRNSLEGGAFSVNLTTDCAWNSSDKSADSYFNLGWSAVGCAAIPLPVNASLKFYPSKTSFINFSAEVLLFNQEIQKSITWLPLYFNHWGITVDYNAQWKNQNSNWQFLKIAQDFKTIGDKEFVDYISLNLNLKASVNWGSLTSGTGFGAGVIYQFHGVKENQSPWGINISSSLYF